MKFVTGGKQEVAVGMYWARLSGVKPKSEIVLLSSEIGKKNGFLRTIKSGDSKKSWRVQAALIADDSLKGVISGAAALADIYSDIIFISEIGGEKFWICAISDHEVLAGGDKIVSTEDLVSEIEDLSSSFGDGNVPSIVVTEFVVQETGIEHDDVSDFDTLIKNGDVEKFSSHFSDYKIQKVSTGTNKIIVYAGILSIGLIAFQIIGPGFGKKKPILVDTPEIDFAAIALNEQRATEEKERQALLAARDEEIKWATEEIIAVENYRYIDQAFEVSSVYPRFVGGWKMEKVFYSQSNKDFVQVMWVRDGVGTPSSLRSGLGDEIKTKVDLGGQTAISFIGIPVRKSDLSQNIIDVISSNKFGLEDFINDFLSAGASWKFGDIQKTDRPAQISGVRDQTVANQRQLSLDGKSLSINGSGDSSLKTVVGSIRMSKSFKLIDFVYQLEDYSWKINGEFYDQVK